ncbi:MAG TPA: Calx-beta domain-containing protein [Candidatus Binatia bacterium]|jgi:hypothetical protein|nr:Calx-beta domain-containing protein [Candidatus Binatia bacterium]
MTRRHPLLSALWFAALVLAPKAATALTYSVSNTNNSGAGSLRQAILDANAHAGADTITFSLGANKTIAPTTAFPAITGPTIVDGTTQPGWAGTPIVELSGQNAGQATGLMITGGPTTIRGLVVNRFGARGIYVASGGNAIEGCYVGTNVAGTAALGNAWEGILVGAQLTRIGGSAPAQRNVISGNMLDGVIVTGGVFSMVYGNYIGTNAAGTAALGNGGSGIRTLADATQIGAGGQGNVISGNARPISLESASNFVQANLIGLDATGTAPIPNLWEGIVVRGPNNVIGSSDPIARNVISGNDSTGVYLGAEAVNCAVAGNYIGTNAAGTAAIANGGYGIVLRGSSNEVVGNVVSGNARGVVIDTEVTANVVQGNIIGLNATGTAKMKNGDDGIGCYGFGNQIGGSAPGEGNVLSGNDGYGISLYGTASHDNVIEGNKIGTGADGVTLLGNDSFGIRIVGAFDNTIGGTVPGAGNVIAGNGWSGIKINWGTGNAMLGNSFFDNDELGIDLDPRGIDANDAGDGDGGPNAGQNFPGITAADVVGATTEITGVIDSTPNAAFRIELFSSPTCDPSGFGEGRTFLAAVDAWTDGAGHAPWTVVVPQAIVDPYVTATATSAGRNTSEFSPCAAVGAHGPGTLQFSAKPQLGWEHDGTVTVTVTRTFGASGAVSVHYATGGGNATPDVDYTAVSGTLQFADGEVVKTFGVPVVFDLDDEGNQESIGLTLTAPTGGAGLGAWAVSELILIDYDPSGPVVKFSDASVVEGDGGQTFMAFTITVTPGNNPVGVGYETFDGSAHAGEDYESVSGKLIFQPGDAPKTVLVPVIGDDIVEGEESFYLDLTDLDDAVFADPTGEGTIDDDDGAAPAPPVCTGGTTFMKPRLVISRLGGMAGDEVLKMSGRMLFPAGSPAGMTPLDATSRGAQVLIQDLGAGSSLLALTHQTHAIAPGAFGASPCNPTHPDGWTASATLTSYKYLNRSGALLSAGCAPGSASALHQLSLRDRRAARGTVEVKVQRNPSAIALPVGPLRVTVVLGADADAGAAGACAVHTFTTCDLNGSGTTLTCR